MTVKIAYNACRGLFMVTLPLARRMADMGHAEARKALADYHGKLSVKRSGGNVIPNCERRTGAHAQTSDAADDDTIWYGLRTCARHDSHLIQAIEEMGDRGDCDGTKLRIVVIPADAEFSIKSTGGYESVQIREDGRWVRA
jgi:hypothetical protein